MAIQVVTPQNFTEFVQTGKVPEFKPPEAPKPAEGAAPASAAAPPKEGVSAEPKQTPTRGADGKFTATKEGDKTPSAASSSDNDDEGEKDLPEVVRRKIDKKHRQAKEAEEFARGAYRKQLEAEQRAEQLQKELEATKTKSRPAPEAPKEPKPEDFTTVGEYTDALVAYRVEQRFAAEKANEARQREAEEKAAREREFGKRLNASREKHDDFDQVLQSIANTDLDRVHSDVTEYIQESDTGPELLYHLAKNPDVLDRLRKLSPRRFIAELGKLETKLESTPAPANDPVPKLSDIASTPASPTAVSKAPAPIAALSSDKATVVNKDPASMSFQELRAYERQRAAERRAQH
jgi:hypothetical protein